MFTQNHHPQYKEGTDNTKKVRTLIGKVWYVNSSFCSVSNLFAYFISQYPPQYKESLHNSKKVVDKAMDIGFICEFFFSLFCF